MEVVVQVEDFRDRNSWRQRSQRRGSWRLEAAKAGIRGRRSWRKEIVEREISESRIHEGVKSCRRETL